MNNFTVPFLAWMTLLLGLGQMTFTIEAAALSSSSSSSTSTSFSSSARKRRKMPAMEFWLAAKVTEAQHEMEAQRVLRDVYNMKTFEDIMLSSFSMSVGEATPPVVGSSTAMPTTAMPTTAMPTTAAAATDAPLFTTVAPTSAPTGVLSPVDPVIPLLPSTAAPTIAPSSFEGDNPNEFAVSEGVVPTVHDRDAESSGKEGIATWLVVASLAMAVAVMGALWVGRRRRSPMAAGFDASGGGSSISSSSRLVEV